MATIKAGTYRFNDVLSANDGDEWSQEINFYFDYSNPELVEGVTVRFYGSSMSLSWYSYEYDFNWFTYILTQLDPTEVVVDGTTYNVADYLGVTVPGQFNAHKESWNDARAGQTITIPTDSEVSTEFYDWFTANAVEQKQISGVWKFKEFSKMTFPVETFDEKVKFEIPCTLNNEALILYCTNMHVPAVAHKEIDVVVESSEPDLSDYGRSYPDTIIISTVDGWRTSDFGLSDGFDVWAFGTEPQYVSVDFYNWLTENATQPSASVTYNGSTIANLFGGQTATLKCAGMKMDSDVVVIATPQESESNPIDEIFPADIWIEGEYTFDKDGVSVPIKYKYRADRTDPQDIEFIVEIYTDYHVVIGAKTANLLDYYCRGLFEEQTRIHVAYEQAQILKNNPVIIYEVDWGNLFNAAFADYGITVDYFIGEASFAVGKNFNCDTINNFTTIGYRYSKYRGNVHITLEQVASIFYEFLPISVSWYCEDVPSDTGEPNTYAYSNTNINAPVFQISNYNITENGTYFLDQYTYGATGTGSITVDVPTYITVATADDLPTSAEDGTVALIGTSGAYTGAYERISGAWVEI